MSYHILTRSDATPAKNTLRIAIVKSNTESPPKRIRIDARIKSIKIIAVKNKLDVRGKNSEFSKWYEVFLLAFRCLDSGLIDEELVQQLISDKDTKRLQNMIEKAVEMNIISSIDVDLKALDRETLANIRICL